MKNWAESRFFFANDKKITNVQKCNQSYVGTLVKNLKMQLSNIT